MMRAVGFRDEDLKRPLVLVTHAWTDIQPCNANHRRMAELVKEGIREAGGTPVEASTISVNDAMAMGTEGMKSSLISREVIADSIELFARGHLVDGLVAISGCDKTIPAAVMALVRLDLPGLMLYGGSIMPGRFQGKDVTIQDVFEAVGAHARGAMTDAELREVELGACPGAGACGGQFTANTMATAFEALGISPAGSSGVPAADPARDELARECGRLVMRMLEGGRRPSQVVTRTALLNAIAAVMATGGSTNAVLHLLAVAQEAKVPLALDDFDRVSARTPLLADMKPWGRFTAPDMHEAGGIMVVMKRLLEAGVVDGSAMTVTGRTLADEARAAREAPGQQVIAPL
ncbi:MAG: dihydroxy-acid dehydratase, partial [Chloroflexi bacterium]|nr:dihydroxy-acid dehydratase [Chloroflexota bacterium]